MATDTTPSETPATAAHAPGWVRPFRINVELYERMVASGVFGDKSRAFLWEGQLVEKASKMTKGRPHVTALNELYRRLSDLLRGAEGYFVEQEQPLALGDASEPEPDLKCVRGANRDYTTRTPTTHDCPLVVEVADSSLRDDVGERLRVYAAAGVLVYWVVNIPRRRIDVYSSPSGPGASPSYLERHGYGPGEEAPVVLDGREVGRVAVDDLLIEPRGTR